MDGRSPGRMGVRRRKAGTGQRRTAKRLPRPTGNRRRPTDTIAAHLLLYGRAAVATCIPCIGHSTGLKLMTHWPVSGAGNRRQSSGARNHDTLCQQMISTTCQLYPVYTIEQTSSKRRANVFKIHVLIARHLLNVC